MKVLHVSTATSWRGGEQQITYLLEELQRMNVPQVICCPEGSPLLKQVQRLSLEAAPFTGRGLLDLSLAKHLAAVCKQQNVSLVHAHDSHAHSAAVLSYSVFGNKLPVILSRRVDFPVSQNAFSRWKYNHKSIRKILCVSEKTAEVLRRDIADPSRIAIVYDGIDASRAGTPDRTAVRREFGWPESTRIVGNASALADHKDYFTFADTASLVIQQVPGVKFLIVGEGQERGHISKHIADRNMQDHIIMTGFRNDVPRLLSAFDVFLMTSVTEGLGSILLDAFAAGVPVVATAAGGIPEIVKPEVTGLLAPVKDSVALAGHVQRLLTDSTLSNNLRTQALAFVKGFTKDKMAEATLKYYKEAASQ